MPKWPLVTRSRLEREVNDAVRAEFARVSAERAQPLTRGWAVDLNYELYHAADSRVRPLVYAALQQAAAGAAAPHIPHPDGVPAFHRKIGTTGTAVAE